MNLLTEKAFELSKTGIFAYSDVLVWLEGTRNAIKNQIKRAIASGEILHIRRGLYCLAAKYNKYGISRNVLANLIYGPSYISMEAALAFHGWIPEAVHSVTSVSQGRAKSFATPIGFFDYVQVTQHAMYAGVVGVEGPNDAFMVAKPLKALADYVASHGLDWEGIEPLEESLRIETENLETITVDDFNELDMVYKSARARRFLAGLRKELGK